MSAAPPKPVRTSADRRSGTDRRKVDVGPPGKHDRRQRLESRQPEVVEVEMTDSAWVALVDEMPKPPEPKPPEPK